MSDFVASPLVSYAPAVVLSPYHMPVALYLTFRSDGRGPLEHRDTWRRFTSLDIALGHRPDPKIATRIRFLIRRRSPNPGIKSASCVRASELSLWIDGRKSRAVLDPKSTSEWLTFEPGPDRPTHFRNLVVQW